MTTFIVKYTTRNSKNQEVHKQFEVKAKSLEIAKAMAQQKLSRRHTYNCYSDHIYSVTEK